MNSYREKAATKLRTRRRMSQKELANAAGLSADTNGKYEHGAVGMSLESTTRICDVFDVRLDDFISRSVEERAH